MSDLISRSALIELLKSHDDITLDRFSELAVIRLIKEQPTVYDIDKVVEVLEKQENIAILNAPNTGDIYNADFQKWMMKSYGFKEAIDIVKRGGIYE